MVINGALTFLMYGYFILLYQINLFYNDVCLLI